MFIIGQHDTLHILRLDLNWYQHGIIWFIENGREISCCTKLFLFTHFICFQAWIVSLSHCMTKEKNSFADINVDANSSKFLIKFYIRIEDFSNADTNERETVVNFMTDCWRCNINPNSGSSYFIFCLQLFQILQLKNYLKRIQKFYCGIFSIYV